MTLNKIQARTLVRKKGKISVVIPAHNEAETIAQAIADARLGLDMLKAPGEVVVSASGCTDGTADVASEHGAKVVISPIGKGAAIKEGVRQSVGDVICLVDGDLTYYGPIPLVALLVEPILAGIADATISDLYWRPIFPDQWFNAFFAPLAGRLFPEMLAKAGSTPWSGQRAAARSLWPEKLPDNFTVDLALVLHWNWHADRFRPVPADDWFNPIRPKPELLAMDYDLLVRAAIAHGRTTPDMRPYLDQWFSVVQDLVDGYDEKVHNPREYEAAALERSLAELRTQLAGRSGQR
ncbi:MAG: glycosyltransferase [Actinophytocola sp.]|uniref:glycosyltransferase family 2 protein n=1 Tax=Actinophytocola sp. TaxID=1872138 RepID=UPI003C723CEB